MKRKQLKNFIKCVFLSSTIVLGTLPVNAVEKGFTKIEETHRQAVKDKLGYSPCAELDELSTSIVNGSKKSGDSIDKVNEFLEKKGNNPLLAYIIGLANLIDTNGNSYIILNTRFLSAFTGRCKSAIGDEFKKRGYTALNRTESHKRIEEFFGNDFNDPFKNWTTLVVQEIISLQDVIPQNPAYVEQETTPEQVIAPAPQTDEFQEFKETLDRYRSPSIIPPEEISQICKEVNGILASEPSLLRINGPTMVVGDLHGNFDVLYSWLEKHLLYHISKGGNVLFLGDYVDRGPESIEIVASLFKLKTMFPDQVYLLRGNHEVINMNANYGFGKECLKKYNNINALNILKQINSTFDYLSFAAVVNNTTFCVHGGISPELMKGICIIDTIQKPCTPNTLRQNELAMNLLWSDPINTETEFSTRDKKRGGAGLDYGHLAVNTFLESNGLNRICRAHECVARGYKDEFGNGQVITIFSVSKYCGYSNEGAIALINDDGYIDFIPFNL